MNEPFDVQLNVFDTTLRFAVLPADGLDVERWRACPVHRLPDGRDVFRGSDAWDQDATPERALGRAVTRAVGKLLAERAAHAPPERAPAATQAVAPDPSPAGAATSAQAGERLPEPVAFVSREERATGLAATIDAAVERLAAQLAAGHTREFLETLAFYAKFHRYSVNNMLLILGQKPDATRVAGLKRWNELGYRVRAGEQALWIWAPITKKEVDPQTGEIVEAVVGFRPAPVFDASQLANLAEKPLPDLAPALPDDVEPLYRDVKRRVGAIGIAVTECALPGGVYGVSSGGAIRVRDGLDSRTRLFTLLHELTHELAHQGERQADKTVQQREFEAEATTFVVAAVLGLEQHHSRDYLLTYEATPDTLRASLGTIQTLVRRVLAIAQPVEQFAEGRIAA